MKQAKRTSLRGRFAAGLGTVAQGITLMAHGVAGTGFGQSYDGGRRDKRSLRTFRPGGGSPSVDLLYDLPALRERSRDFERNAPIALGAIESKVNGTIGTGLVLKSMIDSEALGLD